jgi:membrane protein DedA with SNARE-associated domain
MFNFLIELRYVAIFIGTFIEGPTVGLLAGVFSKLGYLSLVTAYIVHVLGDLSADFFFYSVGYFGGRKALPKVAKFLQFSVEETEKAEHIFHRNGKKFIVIGKITHVVGFPILIAAGIARYPFFKFALFDLIATIIKSAGLLALGYFFGNFWQKINNVFLDVTLASILIIILPFIYFVFRRRKK